MAPVLNSPDIHGVVSVESSNTGVPVDILVKTYQDTLYIFTVAMRDASTTATFTIDGTVDGDVSVIGEDRDLSISGDTFEDHFNGYEVHLYKAGLLNTGVKRETDNAFQDLPQSVFRIPDHRYRSPGSKPVTDQYNRKNKRDPCIYRR